MERDQIRSTDDLFEWATAAKPYGLSAQQIAFAKYLFNGHPQRTAATLAGYTGSSIDVTASRLKSNKKVQSLLTDAAELHDKDRTPTALPDEILEVLTHEARHGDNSQARIRAAEALNRHYSGAGATKGEASTSEEALDMLCGYAKGSAAPALVVALAIAEAIEQGSDWRPSAEHAAILKLRPDLLAYLGPNAAQFLGGAPQ